MTKPTIPAWVAYYAIGSTFVSVFTWPMIGFPLLAGWIVSNLGLGIEWFWVAVVAHTLVVIAAFLADEI